MRKFYFIFLIIIFSTLNIIMAQTFNGEWSTDYVTADDPATYPNENYTGYNTIAVAAVEEDAFVAVVNRSSQNSHYLVGYRDASWMSGRLGKFGYGSEMANYQTRWVINFDQEFMYDVNDLVSNGNIIYVANNDSINHTILAFELKEDGTEGDSIYSYPQRFFTGDDYLWGIDQDKSGRLYILKEGDSTKVGSVMILEDPNKSPVWSTTGKNGTILQEFDLDQLGSVRGITVNSDGTLLYVSNWDNNAVHCYVGDPVNGYTLNSEFNFNVPNTHETTNSTVTVGPHGMNFMHDKNILFVTHDTDYTAGDGYEYGRIYLVNPNSGKTMDSIDVAEWNASTHIDGKYNDPDSLGKSSGYASVNCVDFDENNNVYCQTFYGWAIDKYQYSDILPTIELTTVAVEKIDKTVPEDFGLEQNYPNPFNPTTTIQFSVAKSSNISLQIFSITGELVSNLINNETYNSGNYKITLDAGNLSSGTYFYKLSNNDFTLTKKMTLVK